MLREASIYALKRFSSEERAAYGLRVLTMRKWPRAVRHSDIDVWIPTAGPSIELLAAYHLGGISWENFLARYQAEQEQQQHCRIVTYVEGQPKQEDYACRSLDHLKRLERQYGTITILCWENGPLCHRYTLVELLQKWAAQDSEAPPDST